MRNFIIVILLLDVILINGQSLTDIDFSGISNTTDITNRTIIPSGTTFSASINLTGTPIDPVGGSTGNFAFGINSGTKQCLELSFSNPVQIYISKCEGTLEQCGNFEEFDSITINSLDYTLHDPNSKINIVNSSLLEINPKSSISHAVWNFTFGLTSSMEICAMTNHIDRNGNYKAPMRIRALTLTLPLDLISFETHLIQDQRTLLEWKVSPQSQAISYNVERSIDGQVWENIGRLKAETNQVEYQFIDRQSHTEKVFYRLCQVDRDEKRYYSNTKIVEVSKNSGNINLYPNPANDYVIIHSKTDIDDVVVRDVMGRPINSVRLVKVSEGLKLSIENLPIGLYYVQMKDFITSFYKN